VVDSGYTGTSFGLDKVFDPPLVRAMFGALLVCVPSGLYGQATPTASTNRKIVIRVPFVGCRSDGQVGPLNAPIGKSKVVPIAAEAAQRLSYYKAEDGFGVLAPRGWYCFGTYGSNGANLYVSATPIHGDDVLFAKKWKGFTGPVVQLSFSDGDTSGRFSVARMIARVFPERGAFVHSVVEEGIEPANAFPSGPYPKDKLTYRSNDLVEYETPPETDGLGMQSRLLKNSEPIRGAAMLVGETPDLAYLAVRLSPEMSDLAPNIVQQMERDAAKLPKN
jgi:hypothetical protein